VFVRDVLPVKEEDVMDDGEGLLDAGIGGENPKRSTVFPDGKEVFRDLILVFLNEAVGSGDDVTRGAIVLFEEKDFAFRPGVAEREDVVNVGAAEGIDTLRVVADEGEMMMLFAEAEDDGMLGVVGVLILVDEDVLESLAILVKDGGMIPKEEIGLEEQIVEIHHSGLATPELITGIEVANERDPAVDIVLPGFAVVFVGGGGDKGVFGIGDTSLHKCGEIDLVVKVHLLDERLDEAFGIGRIVDGERRGISDTVGLIPQDAGKDRVKGTHTEKIHRITSYNGGDTCFHFPSGLIGKGESKDGIRGDTLL
jgi:hypothetical protein